jgi:DNA-binding NarL/FixJ family response regulator
VLDGNVYLSRQANEKILQQLQAYDIASHNVPTLTRREKEILKLLSEGLTSNEIANQLYLSSYTIDTHRKNMLQKFNVHNTQALLKAVNEFKILD